MNFEHGEINFMLTFVRKCTEGLRSTVAPNYEKLVLIQFHGKEIHSFPRIPLLALHIKPSNLILQTMRINFMKTNNIHPVKLTSRQDKLHLSRDNRNYEKDTMPSIYHECSLYSYTT